MTQRTTVTAAITLVAAAVTAASAAWAIATPQDGGPREDAQATSGVTSVELSRDRTGRPQVDVTTSGQAREGRVPPPDRLRIPSLGVDAPVVPTGVTRAGNAEIPDDGDVIGWYEYGSAPGDGRGNTVLIGHRDTNAEGPGALFDLDQVTPGSTISVVSGRESVEYRVVTVRSVEKSGLPTSLFRRGGAPQLVVITCGGAFLPEAGGYQENLFAVAIPRKGS